MKHAPSGPWNSAQVMHEAMIWLAGGGILLAFILMAAALLRASRPVKIPAPAPSKSSGGVSPKLLLLGLLGAGGFVWYEAKHKSAATGGHAAPAPSPSPTPTVTTTVTPHPVTHFVMPHLSGSVVIGIFVIGAIVAIVLLGPLLRGRS